MKKITLIPAISLWILTGLFAQHTSQENHFDGMRIINGHSVETLREGEMESLIGHRFGRLNGGAYELFGLDQASIRIGLDYGIKDWIMVGFGRSSLGKTFDGFVKIRLLKQKKMSELPISLTALGTVALGTLRAPSPEEKISFKSRLAYTTQLIAARKITDQFVVQLMPTMVHFNLVETANLKNDVYALGIAGKYQLSKMTALTAEFYFDFPDQLEDNKTNSLSIGFDLNTGSHVFQLHFTNSAGMIEKAYIGETTGKWFDGDIHFGFNMVRTFKLKGRRY